MCLGCRKVVAKRRASRHYYENYIACKEQHKEYSMFFRDICPEKHLFQAAKWRAKSKKLEFTISQDDIVIPKLCPIFKEPMIRHTPYAPSIDRMDNSKGYVKGNVWVISKKANTMKAHASLEELKRFGEWIKTLAP